MTVKSNTKITYGGRIEIEIKTANWGTIMSDPGEKAIVRNVERPCRSMNVRTNRFEPSDGGFCNQFSLSLFPSRSFHEVSGGHRYTRVFGTVRSGEIPAIDSVCNRTRPGNARASRRKTRFFSPESAVNHPTSAGQHCVACSLPSFGPRAITSFA